MHSTNKKWLMNVIATADPINEIFMRNNVPPTIRKRINIETIVLPTEIFESFS
jgi:hypothetical protein